jgi:uncharacterized protein
VAGHLKPDYRIDKAVMITPEFLAGNGIKSLIIDIDNTLVPWRGETPDAGTEAWIDRLKVAGIKMALVSNAGGPRAARMGEKLGLPAIAPARKPMKSGFRKALAVLGGDPGSTAAVGDQIYTDVLGASRCGLKTILVEPFSGPEFPATKIMRYLERRLGR